MDKIIGFIKHYGVEALGLAEALNSILGGLALSPREQEKVQAIIDRLQEAGENIGKANIKVTIAKADIEAAVTKYLDAKEKAAAKK